MTASPSATASSTPGTKSAGTGRSVVLIGERSSMLRTPAVGNALRPLIEKAGATSTFVDPGEASTPAGLRAFLSTLEAAPVVAGEVPPGRGRDPLLLLVLGTALGAGGRAVLLLGPQTGREEEELTSLLHAPVLQFRDTEGLAQGLAYLLKEAWGGDGGKAPAAQDEWTDLRAAQGLLARGTLLGRVGQLGDEVSAYQGLLDRFRSRREPPFQETTLRARINLASSLRLLGHPNEALRAYAEAAEQGGQMGGTVGEEGSVRARVLAAELLNELRRPLDALAEIDRGLATLERDEGTELAEWRARAMLDRGLSLSHLGRTPEALAAFGATVDRYGENEDPQIQQVVAKAMMDRAIAFHGVWERGKALSEYDAIIQRFGSSADPEVFEQVLKARVNRGLILGELGRGDEELQQYDEVVEILEGSEDETTRPWLASALLNKGVALGQRRRYRDELASYVEVIRRFENFDEPGLRQPVGRALLNEGLALMRLGQDEEAAFAFDRVLERYAQSSDPALQSLVKSAKENRERLPGPSW